MYKWAEAIYIYYIFGKEKKPKKSTKVVMKWRDFAKKEKKEFNGDDKILS